MESDHSDRALKKAALKQLQKYGDSLLGIQDQSKKKKKRGRPTDQDEGTNSAKSKKRKKEKTKQQVIEDASDQSMEDYEDECGEKKETLRGVQRHLQELKEKMGLTEEEIARLKSLKEAKSKSGKKSVPQGRKNRPPAEIVVFEDPAKRKERRQVSLEVASRPKAKARDIPETNSPMFHLGTARHDILQFGIKGANPEKREEAQVALAIRLGAQPPKKKCVNYKEYQEICKKEMEEEREKRELDRRLGYKVANPSKQVRARRRQGRDFVDGQVGQYKHGVQFLTSEDIDKVKKARVRK